MAIESTQTQSSRHSLSAAQKALELHIEGDHFHPLEAIALFRRWPRSLVRNIIYTFIFNACFAVGFLILGLMFARVDSLAQLANAFGRNLVISNIVGFAFWGVFELLGPAIRIINRQSFAMIVFLYAAIGTVIVSCSFFAIAFIPGYENIRKWVFTPQQLTTSFIVSLCISLVLAVIWRRRMDQLAAQIALAEERMRVEAAERAAIQANLRALQAQIEPHFLFNTLANVVGLIHPQPDTAKLMLEKFIAYLRATLATTREQETTLGREFALMGDYLAILQIRMGTRLDVTFDLPINLAAHRLPSMLLQPLVENAIMHGLEPKIEGGNLKLRAAHEGEMLRIDVIDTGLGFNATASSGIGLQNVRERIEKLYAGKGTLAIEENRPCGTRIILSLPVTI